MKQLKFYRFLLPYWKKEVLILFLSTAGMGLSLANPYLTKLLIDKAYGNKDLKLFIILILAAGIIFVLNGLISGLGNYLNRYIKLRLNFDLNLQFFKKLQALPFRFFQDTSTGHHLYKLSYDIEQAAHFITDCLPQTISLVLKSIFIFLIIFYLNFKIALLTLALTPFLYLTPLYFAKRLKKAFSIWIENTENIFSRLQELLSRMQAIKAFGKGKQEARHYIRSLIKNIRFRLTNTKLEIAGLFSNNLINRIVLGLIVFYGGYQIIMGRMTLGSLSAIGIYLSQLSGLQSALANFFQQVSLGLISYKRLETILNAEPEIIESREAKRIKFLKGAIEFKDIAFGYKNDEMVFKDLNFCIPGGACVGLVGASGCGKTTVVNLLLRLLKPVSGEILIDGHNINAVESGFLYGQIGVALQEPYLWNDTIENNIRYTKQDASFKEVQEAAKIACIDDFINGLGQGYNTVIGENACKISEGQKQRIAIARAVIKRPKILILDEALSSVDAEIESKIIANIRGSLVDSTVIIISHRISTAGFTDLVYFISGQNKIDIGRHEELIISNIKYRDYFAQRTESWNLKPFLL